MAKLILFNKPYGVLSQFSDTDQHPGLSGYLDCPGFYPAGRLDYASEGLLLLTDDGRLQARISQPKYKLGRTYLAQVEGVPEKAQLSQLAKGVMLKDGLTRPARVREVAAPQLWPRTPPVRFRKHIPTSWLELTIHEGRNRQVRRMTAAVGLPTLRLVRTAIGDWRLAELQPGEYCVDLIHVPRQNPKSTRNQRAIGLSPAQRPKQKRRKQ